MLLREAKRYSSALHSRAAALAYLGSRFRAVLDMPASLTDGEAGQELLNRYVLVHIPRDAEREKFDVLVLMLRKLYAFVRGDVLEDNADSLANQELLLSGHLIQMVLKEVASETLIVALKGASPELKEKILSNMSSRAAETLREDLESRGPMRLSEVEAQQKEILKTVRRLADEGQIVIGGGGADDAMV